MENAFVGRHSRALAAGKAHPNPLSCWDSCKSPWLFPIALQGPDMAGQRFLTSDWLSSLLNASGAKPSLSYISGSSTPEPLEELCNPGPTRENSSQVRMRHREKLGSLRAQILQPTAFYHPPASA